MADFARPRVRVGAGGDAQRGGRDETAEQRHAAARDGRVGRRLGARRGGLDGRRGPVTRTARPSPGNAKSPPPGGRAAARAQRAERDRDRRRGRTTCTTNATALARAFLAGAFAAGAATAVAARANRGEDWEQGATHAVSLDGTPRTPGGMGNCRVSLSDAKRERRLRMSGERSKRCCRRAGGSHRRRSSRRRRASRRPRSTRRPSADSRAFWQGTGAARRSPGSRSRPRSSTTPTRRSTSGSPTAAERLVQLPRPAHRDRRRRQDRADLDRRAGRGAAHLLPGAARRGGAVRQRAEGAGRGTRRPRRDLHGHGAGAADRDAGVHAHRRGALGRVRRLLVTPWPTASTTRPARC